jgi:NitT/TauT family transport system permease protein
MILIFLSRLFARQLSIYYTGVRLGLSAALTTLLAAESTGAQAGIGMRKRSLANSFDSPPMLMYIIMLGNIGQILVKVVDIIERKLTGWQEKIN